jgi:hypothetical protein
MALHVINCSVDAPDPQPENIPEDLSYNDMESIVEIVLEQVLKIENAISEKDDVDTDGDNGLNLKKGFDFSYHQSSLKRLSCYISIVVGKHAFYKEKYSEQFHSELIPPPPKA